ncbi:MAG: chemotaxis protein CheX [Deltaproteobacteria bacterium]|nr:chemotaxis protein CheX [Deltaproteobacteria bacterium]MCX7952202.1 chemotaxis protein CheX [Deltaproteobacteria bacterium]
MTDSKNLQREIANLLSQFAFIISEPIEGSPSLPEGINVIQIDFSGPRSGAVLVLTDNELGQKLLSNLIDLDKANDTDIVDALCELGNIFAGNLLTHVYGSRQTYALKPPSWYAIKSKDLKNLEEFNFLECEGSILGVRIYEYD